MQREIAEPLNLALGLAALGVSEIVDETMANARTRPRDRELARTRAAAPLSHLAVPPHCTPRGLAEKLGLERVLVPSYGRGRLGGRLSARADRLRNRALGIAAPRPVRRRRRQCPLRGNAGRGRADRPPRRRQRPADRNALGLHALSRPGSRNCGAVIDPTLP